MNPPKRIFIIGHAGAGKGVLAQALADKLGWRFIDADFGLAPSVGRNLADILGSTGEERFHHCLTDILTYQQHQEYIVVTTDDSIVCSKTNRELLAAEFTVYLKVSISVQLERISHHRPLLPNPDYKAFLNKLRQERDHLYEEAAAFSLSTDSGSLDEHVLNVINAMKK